MLLGVGIDWAEDFHLVAIGRPGEGVVDVGRVEHTPGAVASLIERLRQLEPNPAEVRVVIETSRGVLVESLLDAGFVVVPVNPDLIARRRGPARKKDDAEDARIACLLALDRFAQLRPHVVQGEPASELRSIARDDERANRDERRLLNRLRADLIATFPAALAVAGADLGAPTFLRMLERWPTDEALRAVGRDELEAFARQCSHGHPGRFADKVGAALSESHLQARPHLVRAKADSIRLAAVQLVLIRAQRRSWERRMGELLVEGSDEGQSVPGGKAYLSFPGLGARLAARIAGEIGDNISQFQSPSVVQCYAGTAPVTRRSGKSQYVVACRLSCNRFLRDAAVQWAFCSVSRSRWARDFYDAKRAAGKSHHVTLRALANRWLEILWYCLTRATPYDETLHLANRRKALQPAA